MGRLLSGVHWWTVSKSVPNRATGIEPGPMTFQGQPLRSQWALDELDNPNTLDNWDCHYSQNPPANGKPQNKHDSWNIQDSLDSRDHALNSDLPDNMDPLNSQGPLDNSDPLDKCNPLDTWDLLDKWNPTLLAFPFALWQAALLPLLILLSQLFLLPRLISHLGFPIISSPPVRSSPVHPVPLYPK